MLSSKNQRGFAALGIIALVVLTGGLFAATKLASNPDLTFFNLGEYAKVTEEELCGGCVDGYRLKWNKQRNRCIRTISVSCNPIVKSKSTPIVEPPKLGTECAVCKDDSQCQKGLVCLRTARCGIPDGRIYKCPAVTPSPYPTTKPTPTPMIPTPSPFLSPLPSPIAVCAQVITRAYNLTTGECRDFPTPCDVPGDWTKGYCFWSPQD